ncbi:protein I'm not dead yet-like [Scaptodrosophila lebanonensis]|uniref:Protein I'm not dead yet-like n=1 Tax=Drosophila lebanonensis TaxID=7225 RepID=A0A6J2U8N5_DROLE|nr:protein I'm not dead yet-like [Scaptodrosophila lebanonensis]
MSVPEKKASLTLCQRLRLFLLFHWAGLVMFLTPLALLPLLFLEPALEYRCAYVLFLMSILWITEAMPLYVTSLLPIVLFPIMGILDSEHVCRVYFSNSLVLFFGSLVIALAIEYCNLHKRVALWVILCVGCSPRKLHFSLMLVTMFISMWLSNSAATSMMCPVVKALLNEMASENMLEMMEEKNMNDGTHANGFPKPSKIVISYYLGVAFAASVGGCATLVGTGTNISFKGVYDARFPHSHDLNFLTFALFSMPTMLFIIACIYLYLQWLHFGLFKPDSKQARQVRESAQYEHVTACVLHKRLKELGPISCHELQVATLFLAMIIFLVTRHPGSYGGWSQLFQHNMVKDSFPVIAIVVLLFMLPVNYKFFRNLTCGRVLGLEELCTTPALLTWQFLNANNHWGLLLLTGGGLALAEGIKASGFAALVGASFSALQFVPPCVLQFFCICIALMLTAFSSNIAMCNIIIPILMEIVIPSQRTYIRCI